MRSLLIVTILIFSMVSPAYSYCSEPTLWSDKPDPPPSYHKPDIPYCLSDYSWSGEHSCDDWEIENYFDEVEDYQRKLRQYLAEVEDYQVAVEDYVSEAITYAKCENDEVLEQHQ